MKRSSGFCRTLIETIRYISKNETDKTYDINVVPSVRDCQILSVIGKAECIDAMALDEENVRHYAFLLDQTRRAHSQEVIVRTHIQYFESNMLTMESKPPVAKYLQ